MASKDTKHNDIRRHRYLFDFESIVDLKLSYLKEYYANQGYILVDYQFNYFKYKRIYDTTDVLTGIVGKDEEVNLDGPLYPVFTSMKSLIENCLKAGDIMDITVLCKDKFQERIIKEAFPKACPKTLIGPRNRVKVINFARIAVGEAKHCLEFRDPVTVDFMILNYRENFQKGNMELLDKELLVKVGDINQFTIVDAYPEVTSKSVG